MVTFEQAQKLLGDIPNDWYVLELLDDCVKNNGKEWVKDHKDLLLERL
jgi:hypothetical protein